MADSASSAPLSGSANPGGSDSPAPTSLPALSDLRPKLPSIKDQGKRGTCLAFAVTASHERARAISTTILEGLSEEVLYWGSKQVDDNILVGTTFNSAADALQRWGQPAEAVWPY